MYLKHRNQYIQRPIIWENGIPKFTLVKNKDHGDDFERTFADKIVEDACKAGYLVTEEEEDAIYLRKKKYKKEVEVTIKNKGKRVN